jgi:hypothetical protein
MNDKRVYNVCTVKQQGQWMLVINWLLAMKVEYVG